MTSGMFLNTHLLGQKVLILLLFTIQQAVSGTLKADRSRVPDLFVLRLSHLINRLAWIIHHPFWKLLKSPVERNFQRFFTFDSLFLYTKSMTEASGGFWSLSKSL